MAQQHEDKRGFKLPGFGVLDDVREIAGRMPSEETLQRLLDALPQLEKLIASPALQNLPDPVMLQRLVNALPPQETLERLTAALEKLPPTSEIHQLLEALNELRGFMSALKGAGASS